MKTSTPNPRTRLALDRGWLFLPDPAEAGEAAGYWRAGLDLRGWRPTSVPAAFDQICPELLGYAGSAWYRLSVKVPGNWRGRRVQLVCEGANDSSRVWVNGDLVGEHPDGYLRFALDVTARLRLGETNEIAVRVDNRRLPGRLPEARLGWRPVGGLLREVYLLATAPVCLEDPAVEAWPAPAGGGELQVRATVLNTSAAPADLVVGGVLRDRRGAVVAELPATPVGVPPGGRAPVAAAVAVPQAQPWSPARPALYQLELRLLRGRAVLDALPVRVGFRRCEARDGQLWLNGKPLVLRGFNRHEDSPTRGMCPDLAVVKRDLRAMKAAGANFVRLAHYPHHPAELDLCDELGLLVMGEIPLYWWQGTAAGEEVSRLTQATAQRQLERMIRRDRCHPAIIFWSVSNETDEDRAEVRAGNAELIHRARALDPSRFAVHVSHRFPQAADAFAADDVVCVNGYPSTHHLFRRGEVGYDPAAAARFWREALADLRARYPGKPIVVTEFGFVSVPGVGAGTMSETLHAQVLAAEFGGIAAAKPSGAVVWCWADHAWPMQQSFNGGMTVSPYGVVARDRRPKAALAAIKKLFLAWAAAK